MSYTAGFRYFIMFLFLLMARMGSAEMGYGPGFDSCGDFCQTRLRLFCTELRDSAQQAACWCWDAEVYFARMDACLDSCSTDYEVRRQRGLLTRFRGVVCGEEDEEFEDYYAERYGGFRPNPTENAPPAPLLVPVAITTKTRSSTRTRSSTTKSTLTTSTRTRTSSKPTSTTSSSSISTTSPSSTGNSNAPETSETSDSSSDLILPIGAIAGIAAGGACAILGLLVAAILLQRRKQKDEQSPTVTPPLNWPPNLERRVSVYYSPDDVGRTPTTPGGTNGPWELPHPGQRVHSVATTIIEDSASDYDGSSSSGSRSTWTVIEGAEEYQDIDLGVAL